METAQESSLDRFIKNRAQSLLWSTGARKAARINTAIGAALTAAGVSMIMASVMSGDPGIAMGALGPVIAGVFNIAVGLTMKLRSRRDPVETRLSGDAWTFLHGLAQHVLGWRLGRWQGRSRMAGLRRHAEAFGAQAALSGPGPSTREALHPAVFDLLEEAAKHYNRIQGYLAQADAFGSDAREQFAVKVQMAADDAMADTLRQCALLQKFPENIERIAPTVQPGIDAMREAADRVESLLSRPGHTLVGPEQASLLRKVLEELTLEDQARTELASPDETRLLNEEGRP